MITYELAKELKDAGFPQKGNGFKVPEREAKDGMVQALYIPTLSELIEACGEIEALTKERSHAGDEWCAVTFYGHRNARGATPEEAVARLWLSITNA